MELRLNQNIGRMRNKLYNMMNGIKQYKNIIEQEVRIEFKF